MYLGCRLWNGEDYGQEGKKEPAEKAGVVCPWVCPVSWCCFLPVPPERRQPFLGHGGTFSIEKNEKRKGEIATVDGADVCRAPSLHTMFPRLQPFEPAGGARTMLSGETKLVVWRRPERGMKKKKKTPKAVVGFPLAIRQQP